MLMFCMFMFVMFMFWNVSGRGGHFFLGLLTVLPLRCILLCRSLVNVLGFLVFAFVVFCFSFVLFHFAFIMFRTVCFLVLIPFYFMCLLCFTVSCFCVFFVFVSIYGLLCLCFVCFVFKG